LESIGKYLRDPTFTSASKPSKPARPYPGIFQALALLLLLLVVELILMGLAGGFGPKAQLASLRFAICNVVGFGIVLAYGLKRSKALFSQVFPLIRVRSSLYFPIALCVLGMYTISHNPEHFIYITYPPPAFVRNLFPDLLHAGGYWNAFFQLVVMAPLTEEFFYRGLILRGFIKRYGTVTGVIASAVLLGALHGNLW
jgi:CAAX protease family protein